MHIPYSALVYMISFHFFSSVNLPGEPLFSHLSLTTLCVFEPHHTALVIVFLYILKHIIFLYIKSLLLHSQVFLAGSPAELALFVEEVEHAPQDGQQQDADDDGCNDDTVALWWRTQQQAQAYSVKMEYGWDDGKRPESRIQDCVRQVAQHSPVWKSSGERPEKSAALASLR